MAEKTNITRTSFSEALKKQVWEVTKKFDWGCGYKPEGVVETLPCPVMLRLDVRNPKKHAPKVGERWAVTARAWRHKEGDEFVGRDNMTYKVVYVEGFLEELLGTSEKVPANRPKLLRGNFEEGTESVWKGNKKFEWGLGFAPIFIEREKLDALVLPGQVKSLRLDLKNREEHAPLIGEEWLVLLTSWRSKEGDVDGEGRVIVHIEGNLVSKVAKEKAPKKEFERKTTRPEKVFSHREAKPAATAIVPYMDEKRPDRVIYVEETYVDGKTVGKKTESEGSLDDYRANTRFALVDLCSQTLSEWQILEGEEVGRHEHNAMGVLGRMRDHIEQKYGKLFTETTADIVPLHTL